MDKVKANKKSLVKWKETCERYVGFVDIMGFKDFVARNSHEKVFELMKKLSDSKDIIQKLFNQKDSEYNNILYTTSFSDSIIIFTKDKSSDSFVALTVALAYIMSNSITKAIPMKGTIAFGEISIDKEKQIFFGQPIIDAFLLQEEVFYYGIVMHNSAEYGLSISKENDRAYELYVELKSPLKAGHITHFNLNWFEYLRAIKEDDSVIEEKFNSAIIKLKSMTSGHPRKYLDNTTEIFNQIYKD